MMKENEDREEKMRLRTEVCNVLAAQEIVIDEEKIPEDSLKIRHATIRVREDRKNIAEALLGDVTETTGQDNVVYSGKDGNIMFLNDSFSLVYESGREIRTEDEAISLAGKIASKLGMAAPEKEFSCTASEGGYAISIPQIFGGVDVFGANVELKISSAGNVLGNGKFIGKGRLIRAEGETLKVSAILLDFADSLKDMGKESVYISEIEYGYTPKHPAAGVVYLVPTLKLLTDNGVFYVNMSDGSPVGI